ncbi:hypothetical protein [uncultured phage MedDCM-OCT-S01-C1]|nr:hypothetical protein [uncultured phage MedDCM-OCT-S01-C1]
MTNQEAFEAARAGDWIAESFTRSGDVFTISGKSAGYSSFADCLSDGESVFYSAFDEDDNREAGLAVWDASAKTLTPVEIHASLIGGAFIKGDPNPVQFSSGGTITGTLNATAFNTIWGHVFEKGNPHETEADQIDQSNESLGDTVQDALNKIAAYVVQLDPDGNSDIDWGDLDGLKDLLDDKAEQTDLEQEILDRKTNDAILQSQINALDPDGDSDIDWSDIENKPTEFPPASHGHEINDVNGLQDALNAAGGTPAWDDVTGKPAEFPPEGHTHEQSEVDGLELRLDAIEGSITDGGSFVDAPNDGKLYGRQSESWAEVVVPDAADPDWSDVQNKPAEFPPSAHNHDGVYQPVGDYLEDADGSASNDGHEYARKNGDWVKLEDHLYNGHDAVKITGDQSAAGKKTWTDDATFAEVVNFRERIHGDTTASFTTSVSSAAFIKTGGTADQFLMADGSTSEGGGSGSSVHIGENAPADPQEGQQWMEVPADGDATLWIFDGAKWLQSPAGKDGKDGVDGGIPDAPSDTKQYARQDGSWSEVSSGLWTDEGSNTISYSGTVLMSQPDAGTDAIAIGSAAGLTTQGDWAVAIGQNAGMTTQGNYSVAIGHFAGQEGQAGWATAVGNEAGYTNQGEDSCALGDNAGYSDQSKWAVALGQNAGHISQGEASIAIGREAGKTNQGANGIIISSTGAPEDIANPNHIHIVSGPDKYLNYNGTDEWIFKGGSVSGISFRQGGAPVIDAKGLISTLSTLRNATKDETTLEGMRDALADAIGGLIEGFEHEIATMPAGDES